MKCSPEHTLFVKNEFGGKMLIVSLYVDDLIYTENDVTMFQTLKAFYKGKVFSDKFGKYEIFSWSRS
jgi:hypothetical protein